MRRTIFTAILALSVQISAFAGSIEAGQEKSAPCAACHGVDGNSVDPTNPKIAGQHASYIARQLAMFHSGKRENPLMSPQAAILSETDMADLAAYFASQKIRPGITDEASKALGEKLYRGGSATGLPSCMGCHGPSGSGNPAALYPALAGQHANYIKDQLQRFRAGTVYGDPGNAHDAIMSQVAKGLSDAEIEALSSYIEGLHTAP